MDQKSVEKLEENIAEALLEVFDSMGQKRLPLLPNGKTVHLMAKAAVSVYEAVVANQKESKNSEK
jgi:hypothetical protein